LEKDGDRPILFVTSEKDWGGNEPAAQKSLRGSWAMAGAVVAMIMDEELEILHVAKETWRLDHLKTLLHGRFSRHLHHEPHKISHIVWLAHPHTPVT
jgi:hypothetical protein